jgi:uncharacterized protein YndB with AHSA1/START domain
MATYNDSTTAEHLKTVSINRIFDLPIHKVWEAWSKPEYFVKWWGPKEFSCPYCSIDFKVGGKYLAAMRGPDGKDIWSTGTYREIVPQEKIMYTDHFADSEGNIVGGSEYDMPSMPMESTVTVTLEAFNGKTTMWLEHEGIPEEYYDDCIKGWNSSLDKMEEL